MEKRKLGRSGIEIAPLVFGGNVFGWTADEAMSFRLLDAFVAAGFNCIDTADVYSRWVEGHQGGESETIVGKWLKARGNRDKVVIATKVGMDMGPAGTGLSRAHVTSAVEASLKRLNTDYIDLYQSHRDDETVPVEEPLEVYAELIKAGKVRAVGASNFSAPRLKQALDAAARGLPRYESLQPPYNLYDREEFEGGLEALVMREGVGVISYYALASGFLTGKYRSKDDLGQSKRGQAVAKYLDAKGLEILSALDRVAKSYEASAAQVALAWLMSKPSVTAPIASATSPEQFADLAKAAFLKLNTEAMMELDAAGQPVAA